MKITLIAGARPNFMKIAPLARAFKAASVPVRLVHTGQHYDGKMSGTFFEELGIPEPDVNLGVGSGTHVTQIADVMTRLEPDLNAHRPDALVVVGDVNSTLAAALAGVKAGVRVAHVEAGLRSFDRGMPEEVNRIVTDALSDWLFTSEPVAAENLKNEGVPAEKIRFVGNVMIDTLLWNLDRARAASVPEGFGLTREAYAVLTLHRPSNVDDPKRLEAILRAVSEVAAEMPVVFPLHPRTAARLREFGFAGRPELSGFRPVDPLGYLAMLGLVDGARFVMTDSGGLQEETTALRVPCITLRENTERPVTIDVGSNELVGWRTEAIRAAVRRVLDGPPRTGAVPPLWDGRAAERIARSLVADASR